MSEEITVRSKPSLPRRWMAKVFGHDYFIAYAHADGKSYAVQLEQALGDEWECFLDVSDFLPGDELSSEDVFALKRTQCLIFLATPAAFESRWVQFELDTFHKSKRRVIPIDFGGRLAAGKGKDLHFPFKDTIWIDEEDGAWQRGPSDAVVERVRKSFNGTRMIKKRIRTLRALVALFVILAGVAGWFWFQSFTQKNRAEEFLAKAELALGTARLEQGHRVEAASHLWKAYDVDTNRTRPLLWISKRLPANPWIDSLPPGMDSEALNLLAKAANFGPPLVHPGFVASVAFSPDGKRVVTACEDGRVRFWDAETGVLDERSVEIGREGLPVWAISFSREGRLIVVAKGNAATILDAATFHQAGPRFIHDQPVRWAELSPDGQLLVTASEDTTAKLWDAGTGQVLRTFQHENEVHCARFSPDGQMLVTAGLDHQLKYWEVQTGRSFGGRELANRVESIAISPSGKQIVTAGTGMPAQIWDFHTGERLLEVEKGRRAIHSVAFSPDGRFVVTGTWEGTAQVWDARTGEPVGEEMNHGKAVDSVAFAPGSQRVITGSEDGTARVWRIAGQRVEPLTFEHGRMINYAAFNAEGTQIAAADAGGMVFVWNWASHRIRAALEHPASVERVTWSADGTLLKTVDTNEKVRVWSLETRLEVEPGQDITWEEGGERAGRDFEDQTWMELENGAKIQHDEEITWFAYSPDGTRIVTASRDRTARIWSAVSGEKLAEPFLHPGEVIWAGFSPDGRQIATGCIDGFLRIWPAPALPGTASAADPEWLQLSVEVRTGQVFDERTGQLRPLSAAQWWDRRHRLDAEFGGKFADRVSP